VGPPASDSQSMARDGAVRLGRVLARCALVLAVLGVLGWALGIEPLVSLSPRTGWFKLTSALGACLLSLALLHTFRQRARSSAGRALGLAATLLGALSLLDEAAEPSLLRALYAARSGWPHEASWAGSVSLCALGVALLSCHARSRAAFITSQVLAAGVAWSALLGTLGYAYGGAGLFSVAGFAPLSLQNALILLSLAVAVLLVEPQRGLLAPLASPTHAARLTRRALWWAVILPAVLGFVQQCGQSEGLYSPGFGLTLHVALSTAGAAALLSWMARRLVAAERRGREVSRELADSESRYQALVHASPVGTFETDAFGACTFVSQRWCEIAGVSQREALGGGWAEGLHPDDRARVYRLWGDSTRTGAPFVAEYRMRRPDGGVTWVLGQATRTIDEAGRTRAYVGTITDISERRRLDALRAEAILLEAQNARIAAESKLKSDFLANMSHELRTPLNAILGFAEILTDQKELRHSPQFDEFMGYVLSSGRHLLGLINNVLDLAKIEAGKLDLQLEPADPRALVAEVTSIMAPEATARGVELRIAAVEGPEVQLDPARFKQVLYNFLSNALKFSPAGGAVTVRLAHAGARLRLEVEDRGPGIAPADQARLFHEFQQLDGGLQKRHQGTGLGLALTKRLVEAMGGSVGVVSAPGEGSLFFAELPFVAPVQ
jgi:PAS domain S-box-containing protein